MDFLPKTYSPVTDTRYFAEHKLPNMDNR